MLAVVILRIEFGRLGILSAMRTEDLDAKLKHQQLHTQLAAMVKSHERLGQICS